MYVMDIEICKHVKQIYRLKATIGCDVDDFFICKKRKISYVVYHYTASLFYV